MIKLELILPGEAAQEVLVDSDVFVIGRHASCKLVLENKAVAKNTVYCV